MTRETVRREVIVEAGGHPLSGTLEVPARAEGFVILSHGAGGGRQVPRDLFTARSLQEAGIATLLVDLLTGDEDAVHRDRYDIGLLSGRLREIIDRTLRRPEVRGLPLGLFGSGTGSAAALAAAARRRGQVGAVVSRGGRPDLAMEFLGRVEAPVLLVVGERDENVLAWNRQALQEMGGVAELVIVPGATHLFEEVGALEEAARLAAGWFRKNLAAPAGRARSETPPQEDHLRGRKAG